MKKLVTEDIRDENMFLQHKTNKERRKNNKIHSLMSV